MSSISIVSAWIMSKRPSLSTQIQASALNVFDLVIQTWQTAFAPSVSFVPPPVTSTGSETCTAPRQNYTSESLLRMFADH